jgi:hypothetical protein
MFARHELSHVFLTIFLTYLIHSSMLETLITNKTRIKLLYRLFLNPDSTGYLRGLEEEFGESSNAIRIELNRFEAAGMLVSYQEKNRKMYKVNKKHPIFKGVNEMLKQQLGIENIIEQIFKKTKALRKAYIICMHAQVNPHEPLKILLIGDNLNIGKLNHLIQKTEKSIGRNISYDIMKVIDFKIINTKEDNLYLIWKK